MEGVGVYRGLFRGIGGRGLWVGNDGHAVDWLGGEGPAACR